MPKNEVVVSDTSPLLNLSLIDRLGLLEDQFNGLQVPIAVWDEIQRGEKGKSSLEDLREKGFLELVEADKDGLFKELMSDLDLGESAAIRYPIGKEADLILLDEREGRKRAKRHGLNSTGVIGILLRANEKKDIDMKEELDSLEEAGFWISEDLCQKILEKSE